MARGGWLLSRVIHFWLFRQIAVCRFFSSSCSSSECSNLTDCVPLRLRQREREAHLPPVFSLTSFSEPVLCEMEMFMAYPVYQARERCTMRGLDARNWLKNEAMFRSSWRLLQLRSWTQTWQRLDFICWRDGCPTLCCCIKWLISQDCMYLKREGDKIWWMDREKCGRKHILTIIWIVV